MTITDLRKDSTALTMTVTSEWDAPIDRVWLLWADPRKLERWWGPSASGGVRKVGRPSMAVRRTRTLREPKPSATESR